MKSLRPSKTISPEQPNLTQEKASFSIIPLRLYAKSVAIFLSVIAVALVIANLFAYYFTHYLHPSENHLTKFLTREFDLNGEANFPAFFSGIILLMAAVLSFLIYKTVQKTAKGKNYWLVLGVVFVFLSFDEVTQLHEELIDVFKSKLNVSGYLDSAWIIPYFFLALVVGIYFLRFLFKLPKKTRNLFLLSGFIYAGSALGLEPLESHEYTLHGYSVKLFIIETIQEAMEMAGVIVFIYALMDYISSFKAQILLSIQTSK